MRVRGPIYTSLSMKNVKKGFGVPGPPAADTVEGSRSPTPHPRSNESAACGGGLRTAVCQTTATAATTATSSTITTALLALTPMEPTKLASAAYTHLEKVASPSRSMSCRLLMSPRYQCVVPIVFPTNMHCYTYTASGR